MKFKDTPVIEPLDLMSVSSSSMSGYDIDLVDVEIELRREKFLLDRYPHIVIRSVQEERHPWEHDERWHKCFITLKIENYFTFCSLQFWMAMIVLNFN